MDEMYTFGFKESQRSQNRGLKTYLKVSSGKQSSMIYMLGCHYILSCIGCHTTTVNLAHSFLSLDFQFSSSISYTGAPLWTPVGAVLSSSHRHRAQLPANTIVRWYVGHSEKEHFLRKKLQKAVVWNTAMPKNITTAPNIIIRWYIRHLDHLVFEK